MKIIIKILLPILAYLVGAIPFGLIIGKCKHVDIRKVGSGNIGATNVGRILGKKYAIITFILDMLKGFVIVFLFSFNIISKEYLIIHPLFYGVLATIGHSYSIFLGFNGGKSVSCGCGSIAGFCPIMLPVMLIIFFINKKITKLVSKSSLLTSLFITLIFIIICLFTNNFKFNAFDEVNNIYMFNFDLYSVVFVFLISLIVYIKHIPNIKRILKKEEKPTDY